MRPIALFFFLFPILFIGQNHNQELNDIVALESSIAEKKIDFKASMSTANYDLKYHKLVI